MWVLGLELRSLYWQGKHFTNRHLPDPKYLLIKKWIFLSVSRYYGWSFHYIEHHEEPRASRQNYACRWINLPVLDRHTWMWSCSTNTHLQLWNEYANICQTRLLKEWNRVTACHIWPTNHWKAPNGAKELYHRESLKLFLRVSEKAQWEKRLPPNQPLGSIPQEPPGRRREPSPLGRPLPWALVHTHTSK